MLSVPILLLLVGGYFWLTSGRYVSTDNAYVQQDMVSVAPEVNGVDHRGAGPRESAVHRGDLLFRIDPRPFRIALAKAEAQIAAAEVQVNQLEARSAGTGADIHGAEANLALCSSANSPRYARADAARLHHPRDLRARRSTTCEEARERLANARAAAVNAQSALRGGGTGRAARARRPPASPATRRCSTSPAPRCARRPTARSARPTGCRSAQAVVTGVPVVTLVRSATTWVEANFKETDLAKMYVGQPAEIEIDAYPGVDFNGHVASIGAGTGSNSRCCRRRTPTAIGSRCASACRCGSRSTAIRAGR